MSRRIAVCGGGISGLATAFHLDRLAEEAGRPAEVLLFEAQARPGGKVRSLDLDGFLVEGGPNGFLDSRQPALDLVEDHLWWQVCHKPHRVRVGRCQLHIIIEGDVRISGCVADQPRQGGLPASRGTHDDRQFPLPDLQVHSRKDRSLNFPVEI